MYESYFPVYTNLLFVAQLSGTRLKLTSRDF